MSKIDHFSQRKLATPHGSTAGRRNWIGPTSSPLSQNLPRAVASEIRILSNVRHGCQHADQTSTPRNWFRLGITAAKRCEPTSGFIRNGVCHPHGDQRRIEQNVGAMASPCRSYVELLPIGTPVHSRQHGPLRMTASLSVRLCATGGPA